MFSRSDLYWERRRRRDRREMAVANLLYQLVSTSVSDGFPMPQKVSATAADSHSARTMFTRAAVFTAAFASAAAFQPVLRAGVAPKVWAASSPIAGFFVWTAGARAQQSWQTFKQPLAWVGCCGKGAIREVSRCEGKASANQEPQDRRLSWLLPLQLALRFTEAEMGFGRELLRVTRCRYRWARGSLVTAD
jgi:hypothetical protein